MIDLNLLEKLTDLLTRSDATTIEISKGWWPWRTNIKISRAAPESAGPVTYQVAPPAPAPPPPAAPPPPEATTETAPAAEAPVAAAPSNLLEIESPMVGTFYARPEPGADPYASVGTRIRPGQTLCIIEAMKIMNPLDAEVAGVIAEVCVDDAQPVEFGQVLFRVDPNG